MGLTVKVKIYRLFWPHYLFTNYFIIFFCVYCTELGCIATLSSERVASTKFRIKWEKCVNEAFLYFGHLYIEAYVPRCYSVLLVTLLKDVPNFRKLVAGY